MARRKGRDVRQRSFEQAEAKLVARIGKCEQQFNAAVTASPSFHAPFAAWLGRSALVG
jgi:hypothetical protein